MCMCVDSFVVYLLFVATFIVLGFCVCVAVHSAIFNFVVILLRSSHRMVVLGCIMFCGVVLSVFSSLATILT